MWYIDPNVNNGYPWNDEFIQEWQNSFVNNNSVAYPKIAWRIKSDVNGGYPYTWYMFNDAGNPGGSSQNSGQGDAKTDSDDNITNEHDINSQQSNFRTNNTLIGAKYYATSVSWIAYISEWLNIVYKPTSDELTMDFKGVNPIDYILSIILYPFQLPYSTAESVSIGGIPVTIGGTSTLSMSTLNYVNGNENVFDLGTIEIQEYFNNFLDYSPYTILSLYLPYIDVIAIDPQTYMGHNLRVKYIVDFQTGSATVCIYRDDFIMQTANGQLGASVQLSGVRQGDYQHAIRQAETALQQSKYSVAANYINMAAHIANSAVQTIATGGIAAPAAISNIANSSISTVSSSAQRSQAEYNLQHIATSPNTISTASPSNSLIFDSRAFLIISRPKRLSTNMTDYAHTQGYACVKNTTLKNLSGYTVCSNADLSGIPATESEKSIVLTLLQSGIYL